MVRDRARKTWPPEGLDAHDAEAQRLVLRTHIGRPYRVTEAGAPEPVSGNVEVPAREPAGICARVEIPEGYDFHAKSNDLHLHADRDCDLDDIAQFAARARSQLERWVLGVEPRMFRRRHIEVFLWSDDARRRKTLRRLDYSWDADAERARLALRDNYREASSSILIGIHDREPLRTRLVHELSHAVLSEVMANPCTSIQEGLAAIHADWLTCAPELGVEAACAVENSLYLGRCVDLRRNGKLLSVSDLLRLTYAEFHAQASEFDHYAQSWLLVRSLLGAKDPAVRLGFRAFLRNAVLDPRRDAVAEFDSLVGLEPAREDVAARLDALGGYVPYLGIWARDGEGWRVETPSPEMEILIRTAEPDPAVRWRFTVELEEPLPAHHRLGFLIGTTSNAHGQIVEVRPPDPPCAFVWSAGHWELGKTAPGDPNKNGARSRSFTLLVEPGGTYELRDGAGDLLLPRQPLPSTATAGKVGLAISRMGDGQSAPRAIHVQRFAVEELPR